MVSWLSKLLLLQLVLDKLELIENLIQNIFLISLKIRYSLELIKIVIIFLVYMKCVFFSSSFRDMTNSYYLKQPMSMCEIRIGQILAKISRLTYRLK